MHRTVLEGHTATINSWEGDSLSTGRSLELSHIYTLCMYPILNIFFLPQLCTLSFLALSRVLFS